MKTCSTCGNSFSDDLTYCLQDGTLLHGPPTPSLTNKPTAIYRPKANEAADISTDETIVSDSDRIAPPPMRFQMSAMEPASRMGCVFSIGQVAAGLVVVIGLGLVGLLYTLQESRSVLRSPEPQSIAPGNHAANGNFAKNTISTPPPVTAYGTPKIVSGNVAVNKDITPQPSPPVITRNVPGGVLNGKAIDLPQPPYPPAARAVHASGTVSVQVLIDEDGHVVSANAVSGHPLLRSAAQAARSARFSPTMRGGAPVKVSGVINYNFVP